MKKRMVVVLLAFLVFLMMGVSTCCAADLSDVPGLESVWEQAEQYGVEEGESLGEGIAQMLSTLLEEGQRLVKERLRTGVSLLAVVLLCSLAQGAGAAGSKNGVQAVELAGAMAITALTMTDMANMIGLGRETVGRMRVFSDALLPVMATLSAATGNITGAAARQGITVLFSQLLITLMDQLLIPLVYSYVVVSCAYAAVENPGLDKLAGLIKSGTTFLLTGILLVFVGYLTASGAVAGSVDASAVKAAKLTISRAVPVVGGILADASETVLAGAGMLKGSVGVVGLLVVLAICLTPFLQLALQYLTYKVTAALCSTIAQPRLGKLIDAIGGAFGLVLGMTGAAALVLMVSLVSAIKVVAP